MMNRMAFVKVDTVRTFFTIFLTDNSKLSSQDTHACLVDFKKVLDSTPRDLLWKKSLKLAISNNIHMIISALYTNISSVTYKYH